MENLKSGIDLSNLVNSTLAQALWAAMLDNDDLVCFYVDLCVIHGLTHFLEGPWEQYLTDDSRRRLHTHLEIAREEAQAGELEFADLWSSYAEPPF